MYPIFKPPYQYVIDSSALFDLKDQYPVRIFPGVWERLNEMFKQKLVIAPLEVLKEIKKGNDELVSWSHEFVDNFLEPSDDEHFLVQKILTFYPQAELDKHTVGPWADPFVIACAKYYELPIIQHEGNGIYKIPAIAKNLNVKCQRLVQFFDDENWSFVSR